MSNTTHNLISAKEVSDQTKEDSNQQIELESPPPSTDSTKPPTLKIQQLREIWEKKGNAVSSKMQKMDKPAIHYKYCQFIKHLNKKKETKKLTDEDLEAQPCLFDPVTLDAKTLAKFFDIPPPQVLPSRRVRKRKSASSDINSQSQEEDQSGGTENANAITRNFSNRIPLSELTSNQPIVQQQQENTFFVNLEELYKLVVASRGKSLFELRDDFYRVLHVNARPSITESKKHIKNNINYKIKNLLMVYPHLSFYGEDKDFTLARLKICPEVLIKLRDYDLRDKFLSVDFKTLQHFGHEFFIDTE